PRPRDRVEELARLVGVRDPAARVEAADERGHVEAELPLRLAARAARPDDVDLAVALDLERLRELVEGPAAALAAHREQVEPPLDERVRDGRPRRARCAPRPLRPLAEGLAPRRGDPSPDASP